MTQKRIMLLGTLGFATCAAIVCCLFVIRARDRDGPMSAFDEIPKFERMAWMEERHIGGYERLMNDVMRKRRWSAEDAAFVMSLLRAPRVSRTPPHGVDDVDFSLFFATADQIAWFREREGAEEVIDWNFRSQEQAMAWTTVAERMRLGLELPEEMDAFVIETWSEGLEDEDEWLRAESTTMLVYSRTIEDPTIRLRIESIRLNDPSAQVRDNAERQLAHYDRLYHGIEPPGPANDCNTCP